MVVIATPSVLNASCHGVKQTGPAGKGTVVCSHKHVMHYKHGEHEVLLFLPNGRFRGTLASVASQADMDWLWDFGGRKPFWIGTCRVFTCVSKCNGVNGAGSFACNAF